MQSTFSGGWLHLDLTDVQDRDGVVFAMAQALAITVDDAASADRVGLVLADRGPCCVALDNVEQLRDVIRPLIEGWRAQAPDTTFVLTSRVPVGLPEEHRFHLPPLSLKDAQTLFLKRARASDASFQPPDAQTLLALVELLDRLPLAIELAAARLRVLGSGGLLDRLTNRLQLLTLPEAQPQRHSALLETLHWSWQLLSEAEQAGLAQLSVFEHGFSLDAVEAVLDVGTWPIDVLQRLVDQSMVVVGDEGRFSLLFAVKDYASGKLDEVDQRMATEVRHGAFFAQICAPESLGRLVMGDQAHRHRLNQEVENILAACRRAVARQDGSVAVATVDGAVRLLLPRGRATQLEELTRAVAALRLDVAQRALAQLQLGAVLRRLGRSDDALQAFESGLLAAQAASHDRRTVALQTARGQALADLGKEQEALAELQAAVAHARSLSDEPTLVVGLLGIAIVHHQVGRLHAAEPAYLEALKLHIRHGNDAGAAKIRSNLGILRGQQGRIAEAQELLGHALQTFRELGLRVGEMDALGHMAT